MKAKRQRILIVDDEETVIRSLRAYLEDEGFEVTTTGSGEAGLDILERKTPDAAIVDIRLPGMDGLLFIRQAHQIRPHMTFLICTGSVGFKPPENLRTIGVGDEQVFRKPLADLAVLAAAIDNLLQKRQAS